MFLVSEVEPWVIKRKPRVPARCPAPHVIDVSLQHHVCFKSLTSSSSLIMNLSFEVRFLNDDTLSCSAD